MAVPFNILIVNLNQFYNKIKIEIVKSKVSLHEKYFLVFNKMFIWISFLLFNNILCFNRLFNYINQIINTTIVNSTTLTIRKLSIVFVKAPLVNK